MNKPRIISVNLSNNPYEIVIGGDGINGIGKELMKMKVKSSTKILLITNKIVNDLYANSLIKSLKEFDYKVQTLVIEEGEENKNLRTIEKIHDAAYSYKLERGSLIIALGGGVVGDISGFAAATWLRGISFIQIPTTLLAMVDASIGGKTGVNHPGGKNLIGAFHQPKLVLIDPKTLLSLPKKEFKAGMAEVIKYAVIGDEILFELLEKSDGIDSLENLGIELVEELIERSALTKAKVVIADEKEGGLRATLNYGHTFGHVVENLCGYGKFLHGEAVSIGMAAVGELALIKGKWTVKDAKRQKDLLKKAGLPVDWPELNFSDVTSTLESDKKVKDSKVRFILPTRIGAVEISNEITKTDILKCLTSISKN